jgi:hypothetical protein
MPNWDTRLEISVDGEVITPIDSFNPQFSTPVTPTHSIEADNVGFIHQPQTATFTMTLKAIGPVVGQLTQMALQRTTFDIQIAERQGDDWAFASLLFRDCLITSASPSNVVIEGAPTASFNGIVLGFRGDADIELK